jgi:hypothetical protein
MNLNPAYPGSPARIAAYSELRLLKKKLCELCAFSVFSALKKITQFWVQPPFDCFSILREFKQAIVYIIRALRLASRGYS